MMFPKTCWQFLSHKKSENLISHYYRKQKILFLDEIVRSESVSQLGAFISHVEVQLLGISFRQSGG